MILQKPCKNIIYRYAKDCQALLKKLIISIFLLCKTYKHTKALTLLLYNKTIELSIT